MSLPRFRLRFKKPIFSLFAQRNELGKATKGQIYLSKIAIGAVVAFAFWLVSLGNADVVFFGSAGVFFTSKVCYFVNTGDWPTDLDVIPDWICDAMLHFGWLFGMHLRFHEWKPAAIMFACWLLTYFLSCE